MLWLILFFVGVTGVVVMAYVYGLGWNAGALSEYEKLTPTLIDAGVLDAQIEMIIARLGGTVEGQPTSRLNFLQRIDQLVAMEKEFASLCPRCEGEKTYSRLAGQEKRCSLCNGTGKI